MQWSHTLSYCCKSSGHEHCVFSSRELFREHLEVEHNADFLQSEIEALVESSALPATDPFTFLHPSNNPSETSGGYPCPLCGDELTSSDEILRPSHHIASHLETLAVLCLSINEDLGSFPSTPSESSLEIFESQHPDNDELHQDFSEYSRLSESLLQLDKANEQSISVSDDPGNSKRQYGDIARLVMGIDYGTKSTGEIQTGIFVI